MNNKVVDILKDQDKGKSQESIDRVGMSGIDIPIKLKNMLLPAKFDLFINLNKSRGIHMSRLFVLAQEIFANQDLNHNIIKQALERFVDSQKELTNKSYIKIKFDYPIKKKALISNHYGWNNYVIKLFASKENNKFNLEYKLKIYYSSTCPCSAMLSRQLIKNNFLQEHRDKQQFSKEEIANWLNLESSILATPHSQRSYALIKIRKNIDSIFDIEKFIDSVEKTLKVPVQTAVKREDEQQFALLNGQNLMFCEDALRRIKKLLDEQKELENFKIKVRHMESLHKHDAVAICVKNNDDFLV